MARPLHYFGVFCLFAAFALLLITSISSPVVNQIPMLKVTLANHSTVSFGSWGYCLLDTGSGGKDFCSSRAIGYQPANVMEAIDHTQFSTAAADSANGLTHAMILHPICCAFAFIAFVLSLGGVFGSVFAAILGFFSWGLTLVVMAIDFSLFGIIKNHVNDDGTRSHAFYSIAMWTTMAAMIALFLGSIFVLLTCLGERRRRRSTTAAPVVTDKPVTTRRRRRFF